MDIYGGRDACAWPVYSPTDAAFFLRLKPATLRTWIFGRPYSTATGPRRFSPLIELPDSRRKLLSYTNLIELHMLRAIRQDQGLKLQKVRIAIDYLKDRFNSEHPLAEHDFLTDGIELLVEKFGDLLVASQWGRLPLPEVVRGLLRRIEREKGLPVRFFPLPAYRPEILGKADPPRPVVMTPTVSFGQPVVPGTGIKAEALYERFTAQESPAEIAADFRLTAEQVIQAVQWFSYGHLPSRAA